MSELASESSLVAENKDMDSSVIDCSLTSINATHDQAKQKKSKDRKKKGRTSSDKRKSSRSSSRRTKCTQKVVDTPIQTECLENAIRRTSSENQSGCSAQIIQKEDEFYSEEQNSSVSDTYTPLHTTRSKVRRLQRRKAYSSHSSAVDSDYRKTKSEPIIITLDSDSDDNVSALNSRPNRSARIRGELIRKLSGNTTKISTFKACDSSSSSEYESAKRKKKSKPKSGKASSTQTAKRKKYLANRLVCQRLKRKHKKRHISHVYRPIRERRGLRSVTRRFDEKKKDKPNRGHSASSTKSNFSSICAEKRSLRSTSIDMVIKADTEPETLKTELDEVKMSQEILEPYSEHAKIDSGISNVDKQIEPDTVSSGNMESQTEEVKIENQTGGEKIETQIKEGEMVIPIKERETDIPVKEQETEEIQIKGVETEIQIKEGKMENSGEELKHLTSDTADVNMEPKETDLQSEVKIAEDTDQKEIKESLETQSSSNSRPVETIKKIKKKIKTVDKASRKRGRPRLNDIRHVKETPILNDMMQIPFLQSSYCFLVAPKLPKCRECLVAMKRINRTMLNAYCRFMEYRKLFCSKNGIILNAGFSEPSEATDEHLSQWLPQLDNPPKDLNCNTSKSLLEHIGDQFCDLIEQEKEAVSLHYGKDRVVTWKRIVQGVREMCDVCYTTLFNMHWVCPICGLAVCIDCYKGRKQGIVIEYEDGQPKNRDEYNWLLCTVRQPHDPQKLVMAQIIPGGALWTMRDLLHRARKRWNIPSYCKCNPQEVITPDKYVSTGICKQLMSSVTRTFSMEKSNLYFNNDSTVPNGDTMYDDLDIEVTGGALKWLESTISSNNLDKLKNSEIDDYFNSYEDFGSLRGNLLSGIPDQDILSDSERELSSFSLDDIIECVTKPPNCEDKENCVKSAVKHFSNRYPQPNSGRDPLPIRIYTKLESNLAFSTVPHSWFCNGRLLFLLQADHQDNLALFQEQWKRGQPILVKGVDEQLNMDIWHPDAFCRDFGDDRNDLVDCKTGAILRNLPMRKFWEGFECLDKRMCDDSGEYMLLKLKDWPPGEDFSEMLPSRFHDLMEGLPLPEYTRRDGVLNLAGRLPSWFVRPDLGPKMYNAYGSALYPTKGTTNLHLDVSDAVNVMVYVGIPSDGNAQLHIDEALKAIDEGGCDSLMRARVRARGAKPGALWHIFNARDADKIRDLLTKVAIDRGEKLEAHHDPIHDQSWYLDEELRKRLYSDYGVEGYAIAQCLGDAVFIPAGAPHQVRNLHSCVKVAEDFVSPENIAHCFKLTQEFRHLSDTHTNHEDKLQIKNIIFHVVRDALAHLLPDMDLES